MRDAVDSRPEAPSPLPERHAVGSRPEAPSPLAGSRTEAPLARAEWGAADLPKSSKVGK